MARIQIGHVQHMVSRQVDAEVQRHVLTGEHISDECAATIASWYQTPNGHGLTFARLCSTGRAQASDLVDACTWEAQTGMYAHADREALIALKQWAQSYI